MIASIHPTPDKCLFHPSLLTGGPILLQSLLHTVAKGRASTCNPDPITLCLKLLTAASGSSPGLLFLDHPMPQGFTRPVPSALTSTQRYPSILSRNIPSSGSPAQPPRPAQTNPSFNYFMELCMFPSGTHHALSLHISFRYYLFVDVIYYLI